MTEASLKALSNLRNPDQVQWYVIPLLAVVAYIYLSEIERKNFSAVWLGVATWAGELIWEMGNGLVLHFTGTAPLWSTPGPTAFLLYAGLNIEITLFFALAGLLLVKCLPPDPNLKILGIGNRILLPIAGPKGSGLALMFECLTGLMVGDPLLELAADEGP
jgi:hypothetical protein